MDFVRASTFGASGLGLVLLVSRYRVDAPALRTESFQSHESSSLTSYGLLLADRAQNQDLVHEHGVPTTQFRSRDSIQSLERELWLDFKQYLDGA